MVYGYGGALLSSHPSLPDALSIRLIKETTDLKRPLKLPFSSHYLYLSSNQSLLNLTDVPLDGSPGSVLAQTNAPWTQSLQVRFRKGDKNDKDLFIEVWNSRGYNKSRKVSDKLTKVYNDAVFGGVQWSRDETKIVFVGERPEPSSYKNYWEDSDVKKEEDKKDEEKKEAEKKADEKPVTYLDEKYKYVDDFGETLVGKKRPGVFIYDIKENTINLVEGLPDGNFFPTFPLFDEHSKGIVFASINTP